MKKIYYNLILIAISVSVLACTTKTKNNTKVSSPSGSISIEFQLKADGTPSYLVKFKDDLVIDSSTMGFEFKNQNAMLNNFELVESKFNTLDETWEMPWGEQLKVRNNYKEMLVSLKENKVPNRLLNIYFRAYDDGIGFRYEFPKQEGIDSLIIMDENTQFRLTGDHKCWWIPGDWDSYEYLYNESRVSEIKVAIKQIDANYIPDNAVNTPITMKTDSSIYLSFHEANLTDYAGMTLKIDTINLSMKSVLVGSSRFGHKAKVLLPFKTPWRTVQISENAGGLIESKLIVNLNEPNKLGDISWFKPMKYNGIWWEMHLGKSTWDYAATQDMNSWNGTKPHGKHGATTENAKKYIDFAAKNNLGGILVEGWNTGWEHWIGFEDREGVFDFITQYPDYDLKAVARYAKEKGVEVIMHHETSAAPRTYEQQMDTAFSLMKSLGLHAVKTGYVGKIIPNGEHHHGQWMVNHYRKVIETAAKYDIAVNAHEPIKGTGLRRTYPNIISREGVRGQEYNAWSSDGGNPPSHISNMVFTRMLAGPVDFTPGVFNIKLQPYRENNQVNTTLAHQLASYVVIYSPIQMVCDLIENYQNQPAFQFIHDVGVNWQQTKVLNG
ncbi:MAG: glycoside hydrolase family 97 catalytic domain-containing protein, partial [Bacteroidales bacterium]|nr:glycoside hydrolase family 97 catalytic domain-containing protein [Bacteroidales bacterium]